MKKWIWGFNLILLSLVIGCSVSTSEDFILDADANEETEGETNQSGLITAGEWNDLDNWDFWKDLLTKDDYSSHPSHWEFHNKNRISVLLKDGETPIVNALVTLTKGEDIIWKARSDNFGKAELWVGLFLQENNIDLSEYSLSVNDQVINTTLIPFENGINEIQIAQNQSPSFQVELAFIVDATGSMSDELDFLKDDLKYVIQEVEQNNPYLDIYTGAVFYRDKKDDYLVKKSGFTNQLNNTRDFINAQNADGGGDFPEAVHSALTTAIDELQWSENARTRIAFLILDAPPHHEPDVITDLQESITQAALKGIKIIPISASGINKETEFLMRFFSISTNSTYVFITNHSGIGEDHIEATVGAYEVEYLNDLMVRLIKKYTD